MDSDETSTEALRELRFQLTHFPAGETEAQEEEGLVQCRCQK